MSNSYYTPPTDVAALTRARSGDINLRDDAVDAAFDKVPDEAKLKRGTVNYAVTAGAADAYTVILPYTPSGYVDGLLVNAYVHATNTGAATINVNSLGVKNIKLQSGAVPLAGDLQKFTDLRYSTTTGFFHVQGNTAGSAESAAASASAAASSASAASSSASSAAASAIAAQTSGSAIALAAALAASSGVGLIGWIRNVSNAVATTLAKWMGWQPQSVFEFMTDAQITAAQAMSTTQDLAATLNLAFASGNKTIRLVGPARYTIGSPLYLTSGLTVLCDDNAEIYLKDNARCFMIRTVTTGLTNIKWLGGIINGNDANQGDEAADGDAFDVSKGFYLVNVAGIEVGDVTIKEIRGHGFNHWNCSNFHFHDMVFDQTVDTIQPSGGKRRDGVTGSSSNGLIENISGYTNDDMVAIASGVDWAGTGTVPQTVNNVTIRNIRPGMKSGQRAWTGARVVSLNGYLIDNITVDDVKGETALASILVGAYDPYTTGSIGMLKISNIGGKSPFTSAFGGQVPVRFYNTLIDSLSIDNAAYVVDDDNGAISALISFDKCTIQTAQLTNIICTDKRTTDLALSAVYVRNDSVIDLAINNASVSSTVFTTSVLKRIVQRNQTGGSGSGVVNLRGGGWNVGRRTGETKQTVEVTSGSITPWSEDCVFSLDTATGVVGSTMTDFTCGQVIYDGSQWKQVTIPARLYDAATSTHIPTTGAWKNNFRFRIYNSPRQAILEYVTSSGIAPFAWFAVPSGIVGVGSSADFSNAPSTYAPGVVTISEIGATQSASFPGGLPGILTTYISNSSSTFDYQEYRIRQANTVWARYWDGAAWTAFVQTTVV